MKIFTTLVKVTVKHPMEKHWKKRRPKIDFTEQGNEAFGYMHVN